MKQALLIFARNLIRGKVKTRLAATIGNEMAIAVYKKLLAHTADITRWLPADLIIYYSDYREDDDSWKKNAEKKVQAGGDLGERMLHAFEDSFNEGYQQVIIIGTDCYELDSQVIMSAYDKLGSHDIVIGPALDGGYYLLGMKTLYGDLFRDISWSTENVLKQTIERCVERGLNYTLLSPLQDIDDEADLNRVKELLMAVQPG